MVETNLTVKALVTTAYAQIIAQWKPGIILAIAHTLPIILFVHLFSFVKLTPSNDANFLIMKVILFLFILWPIIAVSLFYSRLFLIGSEGFLKIRWHQFLNYFGRAFVLFLKLLAVFILIFSLSFLLFFLLDALFEFKSDVFVWVSFVSIIYGMICAIVVLFIAIRISPVFAGISIGDEIKLKVAWEQTKSYMSKIILAMLPFVLAFSVAMYASREIQPLFPASPSTLYIIIFTSDKVDLYISTFATLLFSPLYYVLIATPVAIACEVYKKMRPNQYESLALANSAMRTKS